MGNSYPRDKFDKVGSEGYSGLGVKNGRMRIPVKVRGDDVVLSVAEDPPHWPLCESENYSTQENVMPTTPRSSYQKLSPSIKLLPYIPLAALSAALISS